jgi:uncharacterized DUF497 family protein
MNFEWHPLKAERNLKDHRVSFDEAATVFDDPMQIHFRDDAHSEGEQRFICFGMSDQGRILMIVYTEKPQETIHLISAREATRRERKSYETQSDLS